MKELHVGKTDSLIGRLLRAFGLKKDSIEGECVQIENACVHTPSDIVLFKTNSWRETRSAFAELESKRTQALVAGQRRPFTS
jgi:hypothetical protein